MKETIVLGGGCFWCIEAALQIVPGVLSTSPGYSDGETENPNYKDICTGTTGHAEVVQIEFESDELSLERLLELFFKAHVPTELNKQGNDVGTQYRSTILWSDPQHEAVIKSAIAKEQETLADPIVTQVKQLEKFHTAEEYHYDYFKKNPDQAYCQYIVRKKVEKVKGALELTANTHEA
ncbi:MAG: peptide-methionine (S)-S-oxide reductase [Oceanicoccus sp.]|jgi:peptide-methionine (S)-S-oxide reductase